MRAVIYIQADKHTLIRHTKILAKDLCSIYCADEALKQKAENTVVYQLKNSEDGEKKTASVLWLISKLDEALAGAADFENIGEADFIFSVDLGKKKIKRRWQKIAMVSAITFAGSVFAIMTYNEDVSSVDVFRKISDVFGRGEKGVRLLATGYAIGIAAGIILFFNHFGKRRLTSDPTPMEVEMEKYEADVEDTMIKRNARQGKSLERR